ncbi:TPM domain-containing protein [Actinocatenispora rupis]|uniref:TPM domain-containing protein n=1 Tax=Actinocatenispora rupis TaxID=519421 RepID=A0A8J3J6E4_9ACTN|nr:TPM domain-containing protein [Actinocatenispora rupis]GID15660.1 hypothetical protein Aru02nite_65490 [Actinocatenispora rupis]
MRPPVRCVLVAAALVAAVAVPTAAAAAPTPSPSPDRCDTALYDPTSVLDAADLARLHEDADQLVDDGAEFHLRMYGTLPSGGIAAAEQADEAACPTWYESGSRRSDLLVVAVSVHDRQTGIYYGDNWSSVLDDSWRDIQTRRMNPDFQQSRYADGLDAGLRALHEQLTRTSTTGYGDDPYADPTDSPSDPAATGTGTSGLTSGTGVLCISVAVLVACVVIALVRRSTGGTATSGGGGWGSGSSTYRPYDNGTSFAAFDTASSYDSGSSDSGSGFDSGGGDSGGGFDSGGSTDSGSSGGDGGGSTSW